MKERFGFSIKATISLELELLRMLGWELASLDKD